MVQTDVDLHAASHEEMLGAFRNVHDVWSGGLSLEDHMARRLRSPQHRRAKWYVGCIEGQVVVSLGCYALLLRVGDASRPCIAIGSVHTLQAFRSQGLAPRLIDYVEREQQRQGVAWSLLYSDIPCSYYERLGYMTCPAYQVQQDLTADAIPLQPRGWKLVRFDGPAELAAIARLYESAQPQARISISRQAEYWRYLLEKRPADEFHWLQGPDDSTQGYARLAFTASEVRITDWAIPGADEGRVEAAERALYDLVARLGAERGMSRFASWMPNSNAARGRFVLAPRAMEITMLKCLDSQVHLDPAWLASTDAFREIDHV